MSEGSIPVQPAYSADDCVDAALAAEMERGGLPFATLLRLKQETSGRAWASPEMHMRMMMYVEQAALRARET